MDITYNNVHVFTNLFWQQWLYGTIIDIIGPAFAIAGVALLLC